VSLDIGTAREVCKHLFKFPAVLESDDVIGAEKVDQLDLELEAHPPMEKARRVDQGSTSTFLQGHLNEAFRPGKCLDRVCWARGGGSTPGRWRAYPGLPRSQSTQAVRVSAAAFPRRWRQSVVFPVSVAPTI